MKFVTFLVILLFSVSFLNAIPSDEQIEQAAGMLEVPVDEVRNLVRRYSQTLNFSNSEAKNATTISIGELQFNIGNRTQAPGLYIANARYETVSGTNIFLRDEITDERLLCKVNSRVTLEQYKSIPISVLIRVENTRYDGLEATVLELILR
jgi:hypothetical protein